MRQGIQERDLQDFIRSKHFRPLMLLTFPTFLLLTLSDYLPIFLYMYIYMCMNFSTSTLRVLLPKLLDPLSALLLLYQYTVIMI